MKRFTRVLAVAAAVCTTTFLAGCPGMDGETYAPGSSASPTPTATPTPTPAPTVSVTATTDKTTYKRGENVKISIVAQSLAPAAQEMTFSSGQSFDVKIYDKNETLVYQWARGKMFTMALRTSTLNPNEKLTFSAMWNGKDFSGAKVPAGTYTVRAKITANGGIEAPDKTFIVK